MPSAVDYLSALYLLQRESQDSAEGHTRRLKRTVIYDMNERCLDYYPDVLVPEEAMKVLSIGRNMIYKLLQTGKLRAIKIGKLYRIPKRYLQDFIDSCYNDNGIDD